MSDPDVANCYRPKGHAGACGEPLTEEEDVERILNGQCKTDQPSYPSISSIIDAEERRN